MPFVEQPHGQIFDQIHGKALLVWMLVLLSTPFDVTGPARKSREMQRKIRFPTGLGNGHHLELFQNRILRPVRQGFDECCRLVDADQLERQVVSGQ